MRNIITLVILLLSIQSFSTNYYLKPSGSLTNLADWGTNTNGTGTIPTSFSGSHIWNIWNNTSVTLNTTFPISSTSTVNIGNGLSPIGFKFTSVAKFGLSSFPTVNVNTNSIFIFDRTYSILFNSSKTNISSNSTFSFTSNCDAIGPDFYGDVINNSGTYLPIISSTSVNNLTITPGSYLDLSGNTLTISGSLSGKFVGDNAGASLLLNGVNSGTLEFDTGSEVLTNLTITSSGSVSLSSNLLIDNGSLDLISGNLLLNGFNLELNTTSTFNGGSCKISGSPTSNLIVNSPFITGSLSMDLLLNKLNSITINSPGQNFTLSSPLGILDSVKINGSTLVTGGNLSLKSTSLLKGRISEITGGGSISGNISVETFALGSVTDWSVLGVSGVGSQNLSNWDGQIPMTCNSCINGTTTAGGPFASAVSWDETQPTPASYVTMSNTTNLTPGKGFWIFLGTGLGTTSNMSWVVSGPAVTGNVNISLTNSGPINGDGYNLISNPYPCPISWSKLLNGNPLVNDAIYIYNADLGITTSYVGGVSSPASSSANDVIPMGQGFYVKANGSTNLTAQESNKVSYNTSSNQLLKSSAIGNIFRLNVKNNLYKDDAVIRLYSGSTNGFDKNLDAYKMYSSPGYIGYAAPWTKRTIISTRIGGNDYSINSLPFVGTLTIPVVVRVYSTGQYTINGTDLSNIPPNSCVDLLDKLTGITHDLYLGDYVCNISDTTYSPRFELKICQYPVNTTELKNDKLVFISQDISGVFVDFKFDNYTKCSIDVFNILGQNLISNKTINVVNDRVYLDLPNDDKVIFVFVTTSDGFISKKLLQIFK